MRIPIIAGNWKMHKTVGEALILVEALGHSLFPLMLAGQLEQRQSISEGDGLQA